MHISARVDYGVRALLELAERSGNEHRLVKGDVIAEAQSVPVKFLEAILRDLRIHGILESRRGIEGGYRLARNADEISLADVVRALDGPLAAIRGERPEHLEYAGSAQHLRDVWVAARVAIRNVLEGVTLGQVVRGELPAPITELLSAPGAWERRN